ncbi:hypothetical protein P775_10035 [Puniceibacterium antarcticum]|uniref:Dihydroorotate dehydrogenase n=1 Tax=Puniceibacterium antarcticum TaxID=1206336 RepID=A0A2G8RFF5_9RHOB|nr:hypothetical protein [Puniceibacterium antarcticum]PIL20280.1 hypothetical protein P775_10035 [Puniceibacterium antarcticum]
MMTYDTNSSGADDLAAFFDAARQEDEMPSGDFMARLQADALRLQPTATARERRLPWRDLLGFLGGWRTVAGLTAATCAGVWMGVSPPDLMLTLLQDQTVIQNVDPVSGYDYAMLEG